jgi:hypothetical protein
MKWQDLTKEDYETSWGVANYLDKIVLDVGADVGSTALFFIERGAKNIICVDTDTSGLTKNAQEIPQISKIVNVNIQDKYTMERVLLETADIVKMDIEGAEMWLLEVDPRILQQHKEYIIEIHGSCIHHTPVCDPQCLYTYIKDMFLKNNFEILDDFIFYWNPVYCSEYKGERNSPENKGLHIVYCRRK